MIVRPPIKGGKLHRQPFGGPTYGHSGPDTDSVAVRSTYSTFASTRRGCSRRWRRAPTTRFRMGISARQLICSHKDGKRQH